MMFVYLQAATAIYLAFVAISISTSNLKSTIVFKVPLLLTSIVMGFGAYGPIVNSF